MEKGTPEFDSVVHDFGILSIYLSKLALAKVYAIHHASVTEIRIWENSLAYQATKQTRKEKTHKALLHVKEQEIEVCEQRKIALAKAIKNTVVEFPLEEGQEDVDTTTKVAQLSRIAIDLRKQVEELKV